MKQTRLHESELLNKAETALRESESNLQAIFENTSEGFIIVDLNGQIKSFNHKAREIFLLNSHKIFETGKNIFEFIPESEKAGYMAVIPTVISGENVQYDVPIITNEGDVKWFIFSVSRVMKSTTPVGFSITAQDITARKEMEELLNRSRSNLNAIIENTDAFIYSLDTDLRYITYNTALLNMIKYRYGLTIYPGYRITDFISAFDPGSSDEWHDVYSRAFKGEIVHFDKEFVIDGGYSFTSFSIHPIWENDKVIGLSCFVNDRTKEKLAEKELRQVELRYRQIVESAYEEKNVILESIGDAFFATNKNWIVTYWNKHAERLLGQSKIYMLGKNLWEVFSDSVGLKSYQLYHQAIESGESVSFHDYYGHMSKWFEISAFPSEGGLSVYFKDITSRKVAETERARILTDITQRNKDLEQFSYIVSHNLRAPVANIIGLAEELNDDTHSTEIKEMFTTELLSSVRRLDMVITDLNSILQTKRDVSERKETVIFSALVDSIKSSIKSLIDKERAVFVTDFSLADQFITIKSYLHSIFYNLISNSIKYRQPQLAPIIHITTRQTGKELIIVFKDNGSGIDLARKGDLVFGLYKRFHKDIEGKGMGLFMVKTQVETLGGKISIQSEVNKGTEFTIVFDL